MGILGRTIFRECLSSAVLGTLLFTFVLFLQRVGNRFELLVRNSASPSNIGYLFTLLVPWVLTLTVPLGVLVGILIALSRMSSDGEITAMRAAGVASRRIFYPVMTLALIATIVAGTASLWLTPISIRETYRVLNHIVAAQMTAEIQPRIFQEHFPNKVLYVSDVIVAAGPAVRWRKLFVADLTPPGERSGAAREVGDEPKITMADEAVAMPDIAHNRIQLSMVNAYSHEVGKDPKDYYIGFFPAGDQALDVQKPGELRAKAFIEEDTRPLFQRAYHDPSLDEKSRRDARIEFHQRFALPLGCIMLALVGFPLGVSSRKGGKSTAFVMTVFLAFVYWMSLIGLIGLAQQGSVPVEVAIWTPNAVCFLVGVALIVRLERPGVSDVIGHARGALAAGYRWLRGGLGATPTAFRGGWRLPLVPQLVDTYILSSFLFYFFALLAVFVVMAEVYFFFELLSHILKNNIAWSRVATYFVFLTPKLIYESTPMSVLVAVLVTFGVLAKNNEVNAFKACGVSLYRLAVPVIITSSILSLGLFAFDHYYVPEANRKQDAIRNEILGRPVQTYLRPERKWIFGQGSRIFYYKYLDPAEKVMLGVSVYELQLEPFRLQRHISAEKARWEPSLKTWVFQNGWMRDFDGIRVTRVHDFRGQTATFRELDEPPNWFLRERKLDSQMDFQELESYIRELKQSGFETVRLQVQLHKKFSVPLFALIMAMLSVPFAFLAGSRGAMAGVGVSLGIAGAYLAIGQLFEEIGNVNQLPPQMAAWSPDAVFALAGMYLMARMRT
jgi:LPS export ABC transporter permease LptG/LPS export ABC transporter permease LptF